MTSTEGREKLGLGRGDARVLGTARPWWGCDGAGGRRRPGVKAEEDLSSCVG